LIIFIKIKKNIWIKNKIHTKKYLGIFYKKKKKKIIMSIMN